MSEIQKEIVCQIERRRSLTLYGTDDGIAMPLGHDADLTTVRARSGTDITFNHGAVALLHHHGAELAALAGRRLVAPRTRSLCENPLERLPEFSVEDAVDYRVEGRVTVAEPRENLFEKKRISSQLYAQIPKRIKTRKDASQ